MKVKCEQCGKEFSKRNPSANPSKNYFCSRECYGKWRKKNIPNHGRKDMRFQTKLVELAMKRNDITFMKNIMGIQNERDNR